MITIVGAPDPDPIPWGINATSVTTYPAIPNTAATATWPTPRIPWLRETRDDTVSLGTSVASGWTNLIYPINPQGEPA